ncbi:hypothetical protein FPV16_17595 [Methylobacterium sp. W2]|uniref:rod-binding protein n=1 Tax=Methylobacterium sp. W2 TaxID=2598107 RepID=UPI001D0C5173|nr:rod-binding protein [Methylobacterium sp. W2]MCC0808001.1 hypothetical protein [Methylobacterium sp. W2]
MLFAPLAAKAALGVGRAIVGDIAKSVGNSLKEETAKAASMSANSRLAAASAKTPAEIKARKASNEFETMFLEQTLERLSASEGTDGPLGDNGTGGAVYRSMLTKEYAGQMAKSGGVGIADQVYREMIKMQEAGNASRN